MKYVGIVLIYLTVVIAGIIMFLSIRWLVLNGNPVFYESTNKVIMTPEEVRSAGMAFEADKRYFQVEKKKTYLRTGRFPRIEKEVSRATELEVISEGDK